jgi:lysophospholipase L1-like esterase
MHDTMKWIASWAAPQQLCEEGNLPPVPDGLAGHSLTQIIRASLGGKAIRLRFSNLFGDSRLVLESVSVSFVDDEGAPLPGNPLPITFGGKGSLALEAGREGVSDPVEAPIQAFDRLAVSVRVAVCPKDLTSQPGSRTGSFIDGALRVEHWYFLAGLEVLAENPRGAVVVMGDSLTGGRGVTIDRDRRWSDALARRIAADPGLRGTSVLNCGLGGNRLMADGLGPSASSRLERDSVDLLGARWLILLEGVNDIGTRGAEESPAAFLVRIKECYRDMAARARRGGLFVIGGTITPFAGSQYESPENLEIRRDINGWIRNSGNFDAVVDFDAAVRDPGDPETLLAVHESGDHLHLNDSGYRALADAVDLSLFR